MLSGVRNTIASLYPLPSYRLSDNSVHKQPGGLYKLEKNEDREEVKQRTNLKNQVKNKKFERNLL